MLKRTHLIELQIHVIFVMCISSLLYFYSTKKVATASSPLFNITNYLTGFEICVLPPINGTNASGIVTVPSSFW